MMIKTVLNRAPALAAVAIAVAFALPSTGRGAGQDEAVAFVNGVAIYKSDLACAVEASMVRQFLTYPGEQSGETTGRTLDRLIEIELLYQESLKHRFPGLTDEVEERYQGEIRRLGGEKRLRSALSCNDMTPEQFRKSIFRNLSIRRFLDRVVYSRIDVPPDEVTAYYQQNRDRFSVPESLHLRQIFIRGPAGENQDEWRSAKEKALSIFKAARDGADFNSLARKYSEDPNGAVDGGDMGIVEKENLHAPFDSVLFSLETGSVTEPLRSRHGFHIFNVISRTPPAVRPLEDVREGITTLLRKQRAREMTSTLIRELRSRADVRIVGRD